MHIQRFINYASATSNREYAVLDIKKFQLFSARQTTGSLFTILRFFFRSGSVHLHVSNSLKILIALMCRIAGKKVIYTHHNSIIGNPILFRILCHLCHLVIFVNEDSVPDFLNNSRYHNRWAVLPAFIPPSPDALVIPGWLEERLQHYDRVVCTNCYKLSYVNNEEVYGFDLIIKAFIKLDEDGSMQNTAFVLLDPSGTYQDICNFDSLPSSRFGNKILYIAAHDVSFAGLLKHSNFSIRATRTDGDSLSVRESLYLQVPVVASDIAARPKGTITFRSGSADDLACVLLNALMSSDKPLGESFNCAEALFEIYESLWKKK